MRTKIFSKPLMLAAVAIMVHIDAMRAYSQGDPTREILVYFTSGVERSPEGQLTRILSATIRDTLAQFNIGVNEVLSAFPDFDEADTVKITPEGRRVGMPNVAKIFKVLVPPGFARGRVIEALSKLSEVLFAEPNGRTEPGIIPNDSHFSLQWGLRNAGQSGGTAGADIKADSAWDIYTGNSNNIIAIVDGGVDGTHPDLSGKVSGDAGYGWQGHGIHVAGIAAAKSNNDTGVTGVDWHGQLHTQRVDGTDDAGTSQAVLDAVNYSVNVHVLNNSWSLEPAGRYSTTVRMAFAHAYKMNRTAVAIMQNYHDQGDPVVFPAGFGQGIIAVGATNHNDERAGSSSIGNHIDVTAPGVSILSTYRNGNNFSDQNYFYANGTSMAAPHVSGVASLLKGYNPNLYNDDIEHVIQLSADGVAGMQGQSWTNEYGYGRVNARRALDYVRPPYALTHATATGGTDVAQSGWYTMEIYGAQAYGLPDGVYFVNRHEVRRNVSYSYLSNAHVWGRGVASVGWADEGPRNFASGQCDVVPGTVTSTSATLKTYVYEVRCCGGVGWLGWYPCEPQNVTLAYTTWGIPVPLSVTISGPSELEWKTQGTWTANATGGTGSYTYEWKKRDYPSGAWSGVVGTSQQYTQMMPNNDIELQAKATSGGNDAYDTHIVWLGGGSFANASLDKSPFLRIPKEFEISQNYPNPFNPETQISYGLPEPAEVTINISDLLGREVIRFANGKRSAGYHVVKWNGLDGFGNKVGSGIYFYRITAVGESGKQFSNVMKMLLAK